MGNSCRKSRTTTTSPPTTNNTTRVGTTNDTNTEAIQSSSSSNSTAALFQPLYQIAEPIVRRIVSQVLLNELSVLYNETRQPPYQHNQSEDTLPIQPIQLTVSQVTVVNQTVTTLEQQRHYPDFQWPSTDTEEMMILDLLDLSCKVQFNTGMEIAIPFQVPLTGQAGQLEIGCGSDNTDKEAWIQFKAPHVRIWYSPSDMKLYLALLERPNLIPHVHVNADFGNGDFAHMNFTEDTTILDDVLEEILSSFSPKSFESTTTNNKEQQQSSSWIGTKIGALLVQFVSNYQTNIRKGCPLEINLKESIQPAVDAVLNKPRSPEIIRDEIKQLELELQTVLDTDTGILT